MTRREFLQQSAAASVVAAFAGCRRRVPINSADPALAPPAWYDAVPALAPIRAHTDRLFRITVCLRPFRAQGPRVEAERVGGKLVVHNYGHGGSGWSLSWGSSTLALEKARSAMAADLNGKEIAVIGCGALGLTSATLLQRAGARVTIYARERPPYVRSSRATGSWTPDSRVALTAAAPAALGDQWEQMARASWFMYQSYLGMAGAPVEYIDTYALSEIPPAEALQKRQLEDPIGFAHYAQRIGDLTPHPIDLPPGSHPFPTKFARRNTNLMFNVADYSRQLLTDFLIAGGKIETVEFHAPSDLRTLPQSVVFNCTGYGARRLWSDESVIPVRGQIGWLIPQPEVNYGLNYGNLNVLSRRDGIVVQVSNQGDATGWKNDNESPDRQEAEGGVRDLAALNERMAGCFQAAHEPRV